MKARILKSALFPTTPNHLILHVINKCNLRCKTCFVDFDSYTSKELSLEEIEDVARYLNKLVWLDISGGEPFLRKDLPEICAMFDTKSLSIPTNGFNAKLIYDSTTKIRENTNSEFYIAISIDGFEETNDSIRANGTFKRAIETLEKLKTIEGIKLKINTVLCEKNCDEIVDFMKYMKKEFDPDFHSVIFLRGTSFDPTFKLPSYEKLLELKPKIFEMWKTYDYGFSTFEKNVLQNYQRNLYDYSLRVIKEKRQVPSCLAWKQHLVIYPEGDVAFCEILPPFGNLREMKLKDLMKSEKAEEQRENIRKKMCHCTHNCNMVDNFFLNPVQYPKLLKGFWK